MLSAATTDQTAPTENVVTLIQGSETLTTQPLTMSRAAPAELSSGLAETSFQTSSVSLLVIETGPIVYPGKFMIKVFINKPDANHATSTRDPHYAGRIRALDSEGRISESGTDATHTFLIMLPPAASSLFKQIRPSAPISVTFVPSGPPSGDEKFRIQVKSVKLKSIGAR
jgi:hypothetical protein